MVGTAASQLPVLLVDDEPQLLRSASVILRSSGIQQVVTLDDSRTVLPWLAEHDAGAVVLDLTMPHISGQGLLEHITADYPDVPILLMTATNDLDTAVQCMQQGAIDYLVKPVEKSRFVSAVTHALELRALHAEVLSLKTSLLTNQLQRQDAFADLITQSPAMRSIFRYVEAIAVSRQPVLITGETGTGKELMARAVHSVSSGSGELVSINVAGLDDTMFSDTLFGHAKGAFTGAMQAREGLITQAANGTLFLDEIGDLAPASQVKLLRLLQEGTYFPLGMDQPRQSRARIIVATNQDVVERVQAGEFRKDLYYRLRAHHLHIPPLRERLEDLPLLINHFMEKAAHALDKPVPTPPRELYQLLNTYAFPGNVRELEVMIVDAVAQHQGGVLSLSRFRSAIEAGQHAPTTPEAAPVNAREALEQWFPDRLPTLKDMEEALMAEALRRANDNQGIAAGMLGLTRQALNRRLTRRKARRDNEGLGH